MSVVGSLQDLAPELDVVLAQGLAEIAGKETWSPFELDASFDDLLKLSRREDACYDRPSTGWSYAAWYHGRRTHSALRLLAEPLLRESRSTTIVDLGGGTGATPWAIAALAAAADLAGASLPPLAVVLLDSSEPMLCAAERLWATLLGSPTLGPAASRVHVRFELCSWTDLPRLALPSSERGWLVGSYLFDHSDLLQAPSMGELFGACAASVDAHEVLFTGSSGKEAVVSAIGRGLEAAGWAPAPSDPLPWVWDGALEEVHSHRQQALAFSPRARRWPDPPTWRSLQDHPRFHRFRRGDHRDELFAPTRAIGLVLDEDQRQAAEPDDRATVIVGAAGSGKSMVLIERVARTVESWDSARGPLKVLVTTFNKGMIGRLRAWLDGRLSTTGARWLSTGSDGAYLFSDGRGSTVQLLNLDKLPPRLFRVPFATHPRFDAGMVDRFVAERASRGEPPVTSAQASVLKTSFLEAELRRVIYGLGVWGSHDAYLALENRTGRRTPISTQQKELIWAFTMERGFRTFTHCRIDALERARELPAPLFTHVFVDECQDSTPADFELLSRLVPDPNRLVVAGDEAQAMHLGGSYRRPGRMEVHEAYRNDGPAFRLWNAWPLDGSYRLPVRVCECVEPLARAIEEDRRGRGEEHDVSVPTAKKSAVLGVRPVVLSAATWERGLAEVFGSFGRLLTAVPEVSRVVSVAERGLPISIVASLAPAGLVVRSEGMREIKGLERACVLWATSTPLDADESELEWVFTILTRTVGLAVLVVDPDDTPEPVRSALRLLRSDRLLCWDAAAQDALARVRER